MSNAPRTASQDLAYEDDGISLTEVLGALWPKRHLIAGITIAAGLGAYGIALLIPPTYTARTSFISPQAQQNSAAAALASLGALSGIAGAAAGVKSPADQYVALMQSATLSDRIIERFKLDAEYESKFRVDARKELAGNVRIAAGKKDNLISVEVDDEVPQRAAEIANAYVEELKRLSNGLALTEAQQRRQFFELQLGKVKTSLTAAQTALQKTGFSAGALKSEPRSAAEAYARTKAEIAAQEVKIGTLRRTLADNAPEMQQAQAALAGMRSQLAQMEQPLPTGSQQDYISAFREYKYQEALFDVYARQFELARVDEAREGTLIQVLDAATPPEKRSKPKRTMLAAATALAALLLSCMVVLIRHFWQQRSKAA
ncbi:Wzz/FepE/Etk N-terminal domain-containing protein [Roseateles sp. BYS180W]|uniref:Wzz/FepE/Etk N-terminal domain-containing protein n=1 Tax=Roseateles rivi TaxID=3299028 RepID=A0ABW7FS81_9BURK